MLFNDLQDGILRNSYNKCRYARIWAEFEHDEVHEERAHDAKVTQDKANFENKLAREEANFQLQQTQRQEVFWHTSAKKLTSRATNYRNAITLMYHWWQRKLGSGWMSLKED